MPTQSLFRPAARRATIAVAILTCGVGSAAGQDVTIGANTATGVNLDLEVGATVLVAPGVSVSNAIGFDALFATTQAWTLTNRGTITGTAADGVEFSASGNVINFGAISGSAGVRIRPGGSVDNRAGANISSTTGNAVILGQSGGPNAPGTLLNAGTIQNTTFGDAVSLFGGGTITNLATGIIESNSTSNAVGISGGTERVVINSGIIRNTGTNFATGVLIQGAPGSITNNAGAEISGTFNGIFTSGTAPLTLNNAGLIQSTNGPGIEARGGGTFTNSGTIRSTNDDGLEIRGGTASVTNTGTIQTTAGVNAIQFLGNFNYSLTLGTGSTLGGNVAGSTGTGIDALVLAGTGTENLDRFLNFETFTMNGTAWTLTGAATFSQTATIQAGTLSVNGTLTSPVVTIAAGGTLSGTGTVAGAVTSAGSISVPTGILTINGGFTQQPGATFVVGATPASAGRLNVIGAATLNGGQVVVNANNAAFAPQTTYTILNATGGVTGTFAGVTSNFAFLAPTLGYDPNNVFLTLVRNEVPLQEVAQTPNQAAAAIAVAQQQTLLERVLLLDIANAQSAFAQMAGDLHPTLAGLLLEDSRFQRDALVARLLQQSPPDAQVALGYAPGTPRAAMTRPETFSLWGRADGSWGHASGNALSAGYDRSRGGFIVGGDAPAAGIWRFGLAGGYARTTLDLDDRRGRATADTYSVAAYGSATLGRFAARFGAGHAWHDLDTRRDVAFPGFADTLRAGPSAHTSQVFGEAGYRFPLGDVGLQPVAAAAIVSHRTNSFSETGGPAALTVAGNTSTAVFTTLGLRADSRFWLGGVEARVRGLVGWRHGFGDVEPGFRHAFANGNLFGIQGAQVARDALVLEAGLDLAMTDRIRLGIAYDGRLAAHAQDHGVRGSFVWAF